MNKQDNSTECNCKDKLFCERELEIPLVVVDNRDGLSNLSNCLVKVSNTGETFYVDKRHRIARIATDIIEKEVYDFENNPLDLKGQLLFTTREQGQDIVDTLIYFDQKGKATPICNFFS